MLLLAYLHGSLLNRLLLFHGNTSHVMTGGELEEAIKLVIQEKPFFLVEDAAQIKKMIQLKESLDQRMGCVIVGPSGIRTRARAA